MRTRMALGLMGLLGLGLVWARPVEAAHHLWRFTEMFSNASGDTQFLEMFTSADGEPIGPGFTITTSTGNTFNFGPALVGSTANKSVLIATANFAALPGGVAPDYILPAHFFATGGGSLMYGGVAAATWNYGTVPTDGVHSLLIDGTTAVNSPTNFAGQTGSVTVAPRAVPAVPGWGIAALIGLVLLLGSGILRKNDSTPPRATA